jgi:hypothetical protein
MNKALLVVVGMAVTGFGALAQNANLKIVVVAGEGAVNIIQQKTAVAPIVEIRDRNDLPVSGATVTFSLGGGNSAAFAGGAQTVTVTTNAAGRAAVAALNPIGGGSFQIQVSAAFQGQTAAATIAQTNVLTAVEAAAQAAGASGAGGSSGGAAAGGASGGGGLSGTTIGILGAAVGGGALAATQVVGGGGAGGGTVYSGSFSGQMVVSQISGGNLCEFTKNLSGTLKITLTDGAPPSSEEITGNLTEISRTASPLCNNAGGSHPLNSQAEVTGGPGALAFDALQRTSSTDPAMPIGTMTFGFTFAGSLSGGAVTGTLTYTTTAQAVSGNNTISSLGTVAMPVTLR